MNDKQVNKLRSFMAIEGVVEDERAIVEKYPLINKTWGDISGKMVNLKGIAKEQGANLTGITTDKNEARIQMVKLTIKIAGCASSYAKKTNNQELATLLTLNKTYLLKYSEERAVSICSKVLTECEKHQENLAEYMVTADDLAQLRDSIKKYETLRNKRGATNSAGKVNTAMLDQMLKEISVLLKDHMDKYVNKIDDDEPVFYQKYYAARNIRDLGRGPNKPDNNDN